MDRAPLALLALLSAACPATPDLTVPVGEIVPATPAAWRDELRCVVDPTSAELRWRTADGPWTGETLATAREGDTVPASAVSSSRTWTCEARTPEAGWVEIDTVEVARPPLVLVITDDLGLGDVGAWGATTGVTPRLDALAAEGVRWTDAYVTSPVCSPSRAGLLTGRQQNRFGFEYNARVARGLLDAGLPAEERTLGDLLKEAGYATGYFGKWHVGRQPDQHPEARGFDRFFGFLNGQRPSLEPGLPGVVEWGLTPDELENWPDAASGDPLLDGTAVATLDGRHLTDRLVDEALAWLDDRTGPEVAVVLSFNAPHIPLQATPEQVALVPDPPEDVEELAYLATIAGLDAALGRFLDGLDARGLGDDALIAFLSDNGCPAGIVACSNAPHEGGKLLLTEGGVRVPMLLRWRGRVPSGLVDDALVSAVDLVPTFLSAAMLPPDAWPADLDGVDLVPWLTGATDQPPHVQLFWRLWPARATRRGPHKLVQVLNRSWLFDLATDPGEARDLAPDDRDRVRLLETYLDERARDYQAPAWPGELWDGAYYGEPITLAY